MKNLMISLFLICSGSNIFGQSKDWKQIEIPSATSIEIIYQSSMGFLFGRIMLTYELKFSEDNGISWSPIQFDTILGRLDYNIKIKENITGDIFFSNKNIVYKFNKEIFKFSKFIVLNEYNDIVDFDFLKTGDIVIAKARSLLLYSSIGELKKSDTIFTNTAQLLPDKLGQKNYLILDSGISDYIVEFNDDLSYISEYKKFEIYYYFSNIMKRIDDRLITSTYYSDDGGSTWLSINFPTTNVFISTLNLGHDNTIFWAGDTQLFFSKDKAKTIHSVPIPISTYSKFISSSKSGEIVISGSECEQSEIVLSSDVGNLWVKVESEIGPLNVYKSDLNAGIEENLYLNDCNDLKYKESEIIPWKSAEINPEDFYSYYYVLPLSNSTTIASSDLDGSLYNTLDKGKTWQKINDLVTEKLIEKEGVIFSYDGWLTFQISRDFGYTWENFKINDTLDYLLYYLNEPHFTKDLCLYCYDHDDRLIKYNLITHEIKIIPDSFFIWDYKTSFSDNTLFILSSSYNDIYKFSLQTTSDDGYSFHTFPINITNSFNGISLYIDYLDNVYVYNDKEIILSFDKGKTWQNITPDFPELISINDVQVSYDDFLYLSTAGLGILKYKNPVSKTNDIFAGNFKVYPNPNSGIFSINGVPNDEISGSIKVFNMHGKLIKTQHLTSFENAIDISDVNPGIYFISINTKGGFYQTKLIKH